METMKENKQNPSDYNGGLWFLCIIGFLIAGLLSLWVAIDTDGMPNFVSEDRIAYEAYSETEQVRVEVVEVMREKDKEPIYRLAIDGNRINTIELEESVFLEYIGEGNNTISIQVETLRFYIDDSLFKWDIDFTDYYICRLCRIAYPWEEPVEPFSQEEKEMALAALLEQDYAYFGGVAGHCSSSKPQYHVGDNSAQ